MSTCNRLDLQTLGSPPIVPKNLPSHCSVLNSGTASLRLGGTHNLSSSSSLSLQVNWAKVKELSPCIHHATDANFHFVSRLVPTFLG